MKTVDHYMFLMNVSQCVSLEISKGVLLWSSLGTSKYRKLWKLNCANSVLINRIATSFKRKSNYILSAWFLVRNVRVALIIRYA